MVDKTENLIKGSDNVVTLNLTEGGVAVDTSTWTEVQIHVGDVVITRTSDGDGVTVSGGTVTIKPSALTEDLSSLVDGKLYRGYVVLTDSTNTDGVLFGGDDSDGRLFILISSLPEAA